MHVDFERSSLIRAIDYDSTTLTLKVELVSGKVYSYGGVPRSVVVEFANAPSPGRYWNAEVKGRYS